jgi:ATP-dependent Zn protease
MNGGGIWAKLVFPAVVIAAIVWLAASNIGNGSGHNAQKFTFSQMLEQARRTPRDIESVTFDPPNQEVEFHYARGTKAKSAYPVDQSAYELQQVLETNHILFDAKRSGSSPWWNILTSLLPFVLLFGFWIFLMRAVQRRKGPDPEGSDPSRSR